MTALGQRVLQFFGSGNSDAADRSQHQIEELMSVVQRAIDGEFADQIDVDEEGAVGHLAGELQTLLTDFEAAKVRLEAHEGQLSAIDKSQAIAQFELDGTVVSANEKFLHLLGYKVDEVTGQNYRMFVEPSFADSPDYRSFWNALSDGRTQSGQYEVRNRDGKAVWIEANFTPISDGDGKPTKVVACVSDITSSKQESQEFSQVRAMMQQAPAMIFADRDFTIRYMNPTALKTLQVLEEHLPVRADEIVGQSIDIFHQRPEHQRSILSNPRNLPVQTQIEVGPETLELLVSPVLDDDENYLGAMVSWEIVTEKLEATRQMNRVNAMMEQATAMVFADTDLIVRYMNPAALKTLRELEQHLPVRAEEIVGQSIDVFHKKPEHQRGILANPSNLPLTTQITVGPEKLDLEVKSVFDENRNRLGSMVTWEVVTEKLAMEEQIKQRADEDRRQAEATKAKVESVLSLVNSVADGKFDLDFPHLGDDAIGQVGSALQKAVVAIRTALIEVRDVSTTVATASTQMSSAAEEISKGAQMQAARLEETASSLEEITTTVTQNSDNAQEARALANGSRDVATEGGKVVGDAVQAMREINESSKRIADIITTIDEIAFQTNLLALNAAVEAARAGEQGRGFAVVAAEVRNLAQRSASSAKEIKSLIQDSNSKVEKGTELVNKSGETLDEIVNSVKRVTDIVAEIAAASQEQLTGIRQVTKAVSQMDEVTQTNANQTEEMAGTSGSVLDRAKRLDEMLSAFELGQSKLPGDMDHSVDRNSKTHSTGSTGRGVHVDLDSDFHASEDFMEF